MAPPRAPRGGAAAAEAAPPPAGLSAYEQERLARIAQNRARMAALDLGRLGAEIAPPPRPARAAPASARGLAAAKRKAPAEPPRRSARVRGEAAAGGSVHSEGRRGEVYLTGADGRPVLAAADAEREFDRPPFPPGDVPFESANAGAGADAAFLARLAAAAAACAGRAPTPPSSSKGRGGKGGGGGGAAPTLARLARLRLRERDVAKACPSAVVHLAFLPSPEALVLAAADKRGALALWDVDAPPEGGAPPAAAASPAAAAGAAAAGGSPAAATSAGALRLGGAAAGAADGDDASDGGGCDGVHSFTGVHHSYVSGLRWAGGGAPASWRLFTSSYDGSLRVLDAAAAGAARFRLAYADADRDYSCLAVSADGAAAYLGDAAGAVDAVDLRAGARVAGFQASAAPGRGGKLNTVDLAPGAGGGPPLLATAGSDGGVAVWDLRYVAAGRRAGGGGGGKPAAPLAAASHTRTCQAAVWAPDGSRRLLSTSMDDTVRVWSLDGGGAPGLAEALRVRHNNQTGRWIVPLRAAWGPASDAALVGAMDRRLDVIDAATGATAARLDAPDAMTAIPARVAAHAGGVAAVAAGTASGRLHVFRE